MLWAMFCDNDEYRGGQEADYVGGVMLEYGRQVPKDARSIGEIAKELLGDPRAKQNRWIDAYHWLAVIADEFVGLSQEEIEEALKRGQPITGSAEISLVVRLGRAPTNAVYANRAIALSVMSNVPSPPSLPEEAQVAALLKEYSRNSDVLHPGTQTAIENALYCPSTLTDCLSECPRIGSPGILIALVLRYCYDLEPKLSESIPLIGGALFPLSQQNQEPLARMYRIWTMVRSSVLRGSDTLKNAYLSFLDSSLATEEAMDLAVSLEILRFRGRLLPSQVSKVFGDFAKSTSVFHEELFRLLAQWLSGELTSEEREAVFNGTRYALKMLNEDRWDERDGTVLGPWSFMLFPLVYWRFRGDAFDDVISVFLRGIKFSLTYHRRTPNDVAGEIATVLNSLDPLLQEVPPDHLRKVIKVGLQAFDPSVRAFSKLLSSLVRSDL